jgi:hypothetical protein
VESAFADSPPRQCRSWHYGLLPPIVEDAGSISPRRGDF